MDFFVTIMIEKLLNHNVVILLFCHDNDQVMAVEFCRGNKGCKVRDFCHDKRKLCRNRKWKNNETSQDKSMSTKISMMQQTVQPMTKIKKGNMSQHF